MTVSHYLRKSQQVAHVLLDHPLPMPHEETRPFQRFPEEQEQDATWLARLCTLCFDKDTYERTAVMRAFYGDSE